MDFSQAPQLQGPGNMSWVYQLGNQNPQSQTAQGAQKLLQAMADWKKKNQLQSMQQQLMQSSTPSVQTDDFGSGFTGGGYVS